MTITNNYNFDTNATVLDNMTDEEARDYFEDLFTEYWIEEYKNNPDLT